MRKELTREELKEKEKRDKAKLKEKEREAEKGENHIITGKSDKKTRKRKKKI